MTEVLLLLGSNIHPERHIPAAKKAIRELLASCAFSRTFVTEPVGDPDQPAFWNVAARGLTPLAIEALQRELAELEARHGRQRDPARPCGPRTLDVDILLFGHQVGRFGALELPSPLLAREAFVLIPAAEVAPDWLHPVLGKTLGELAVGADGSGVSPLEAGPDGP
ncbi:MAG: 2-amino-4-hydroxy-6-hydroxymethyldihydropteridine diphosphokinase [Thermoanaerobaculum sp.]